MFIDELRDYCLSLPYVEESLPFGPDTLVFKTGGKIFALADLEGVSVNLKCHPEKAVELREAHPEVTPGWHMNKKHWNTVVLQSRLPDALLRVWIRDSYTLVFGSLPARVKRALLNV